MPCFARPTTILLILGLCSIVHVREVRGIFRRFQSQLADSFQPVVYARRLHRVPPPPQASPPPPLRDCPCSSNPCLNGGVCSSVPGSVPNTVDFICICQENWNGTTCDFCPSGSPLCSETCLPHRNNDICNDGGPGAFDTQCPLGTDCNDCFSRCL
ncbi:fibropellin-1-like [Acanthaster planci]|uniref:Fibropellin-1-like n=1 Tax=Acanthaster planci TaxID=133434 RepID=A0A8B7ZX41_ACAPL|nr:fibropellin-1-like [Acanthaster planci]